MRVESAGRRITTNRNSASWRYRILILISAAVLTLLLVASLQVSGIILSLSDEDAPLLLPTERTSATAAEHVSMLLAQWNFFRILNAPLREVFVDHLPRHAQQLLNKVAPNVTSLTSEGAASEIPGTFVPLAWQQWFDDIWNEHTVGYLGSKPLIHHLCQTNILLRFAPWCSFDRHRVSEWLMDSAGGKSETPSRDALRREVAHVFQTTSKMSLLNAHDAEMIRGIRWRPWSNTILPGDVDGASPGGSVFLKRTRTLYEVILAMRRPIVREGEGSPSTPFTYMGKIPGFHACMFGSKRNISATFPGIDEQLLRTTRPEFLHIVTSTDGMDEYPGSEAEQRVALFTSFLQVVGRAQTILAVEREQPTRKHGCVICRGFFPREMCRATILSELQRNVPVELVMIFRPDMYMWNPVHLNPYVNDVEIVSAEDPSYKSLSSPATPVTKWRLHTKPLWSLVVDKGFLPTTFGVYNDVNITRSTVVVHCRVTFPLDLHWIGDPILIGHWHVMNHWLECFSVITSSLRIKWIDDNAGETHHAQFYQYYMRPMFELGVEVGAVYDPVDLRIFDFQFSLYRSDPIANAQLLSLTPNYVAYQQQTIFRKFATKWDYGECMRYYFVPKQFNVSSFYYNPRLFFFGEIGRIKMVRMPQRMCSQVQMPPGLQTCFAQYQRIVFYKKGKNIHNPCKPYCGVFPLLFKEGMCAHVGNKGPRQRYIATYSTTPMFRNESGEVLRFNLVNPQYVRGDTLWFEKQRAREEASREREAKEKREISALTAVAADDQSPPVELTQRTVDDDRRLEDDEWKESFTRPPVPGGELEAPKDTKKYKRFRFVRGKDKSKVPAPP